MSVIAFIPVRGGSKSIPGKTLKFLWKTFSLLEPLALQQSHLLMKL